MWSSNRPSGRPLPVCRFAPSPTGPLHLGNALTALSAWQDCMQHKGTFVLRIEDTDAPRVVPGSAAAIIDDMRWLGLAWQEGPDVGGPAGPYVQSERHSLYLTALRQLAAKGCIYPCTCSRRDMQSQASAPHGSEGPIYNGTCRRSLAPLEMEPYLYKVEHCIRSYGSAAHLPFSLRFNTATQPAVHYMEEGEGLQEEILAQAVGDFVIYRRDGLWAYQFVCAVDDALMGITRVVRGDDLRNSAGKQAGLITALGFKPPVYRHVALAADAAGNRLSKRDGSASIRSLRQGGISPTQAREICMTLPTVKANR